MKMTNFEFVPTFTSNSNNYDIKESNNSISENQQQQTSAYEPEYKKKEKTELCKFWARGNICPFEDDCAFAHGDDELQKKTHVAKQYRMTLCKSYMQ